MPNIDGRSAIARRYRDIVASIIADQGGADQCSESRLQLIRRFAACAVLAEQIEAQLANGATIDVQQHSLLCSTLTRLITRLGIDRVARDAVPSLAEYLAARTAETTADTFDDEAAINVPGEETPAEELPKAAEEVSP